ncbi:MAG: hypothetical protein IKT02_08135 [Bacteroidales bacterium]|nr:hypothetical protein [Bacteroidales bacterium]
MIKFIRNISVIILLLPVVMSGQHGYCQSVTDSCINIPFVKVAYSFQVPLGAQTEWFGVNSTIGGGFSYKTNTNLIIGIDWGYVFGNVVKNQTELLKYLYASSGYIINRSGQEAIVTLYERGHQILFRMGKLYPLKSLNPNSGLFFTGGLGLMTHKIRIDVFEDDVPELSSDYKKGYDRLSVGPSAGAQFGFINFADNTLFNFYGALEAVYGFTRNIRPYNFDTMSPDKSWKHDLYVGIKVGWLLPLYPKKPKDFYYY